MVDKEREMIEKTKTFYVKINTPKFRKVTIFAFKFTAE